MELAVSLVVVALLVLASGADIGPSWSYSSGASDGPEHWASLSEAWKLCGSGKLQSPIDIDTSDTTQRNTTHVLHQSYQTTNAATLVNTGHAIELIMPRGANFLKGGPLGSLYELQQLYFHTKSEHTIDGILHPLEMQLAHKSASGEQLIVSILWKQSKNNNAFLDQIIAFLDTVTEAGNSTTIPIDLHAGLPIPKYYYYYSGSLTSPPCTENVIWLVMEEVMEASEAQIELLRRSEHADARPIQRRNGRPVIRYQVVHVPSLLPRIHVENPAQKSYVVAVVTLACLAILLGCYIRQRRKKELDPDQFEDVETEYGST